MKKGDEIISCGHKCKIIKIKNNGDYSYTITIRPKVSFLKRILLWFKS